MIARVSAKILKNAAEFVSAGISNEQASLWLKLTSLADTGSVQLKISGIAEYTVNIPAKVMKEGFAFVNSRVFVELLAKVKDLSATVNLLVSGDQLVMTDGTASGFKYELPTSQIAMAAGFTGGDESAFEIDSTQLQEVIAAMKAIKEAESDTDQPVVEVMSKLGTDKVQFVAYTRLRSVSVWVDAITLGGNSHFYLTIEHLLKMDKAVKLITRATAKAKEQSVIVHIRVQRSTVSFFFGSSHVGDSCRVDLRKVVKERSNINEMIAIMQRPENVRMKLIVEGTKLKQAYDRLDAFGKRNDSAHHRIDFEVVMSVDEKEQPKCEMIMRAFGMGVGQGREVVPVRSGDVSVPPAHGKSEICSAATYPALKFAAAGNKLADLLRISKFGTVAMVVGRRNILLTWSGDAMEYMAILAGMQVEGVAY